MTESSLKNIVRNSPIDTRGGPAVIGDHNVLTQNNFYYSAPYQDLKQQLDDLDARFIKTQEKSKKYPDEEDFKVELIEIDGKRSDLAKKIEALKHDVIRLAETFNKIPINTERLQLARHYFEAGDYAAARGILDAEQMSTELDALLSNQHLLQQQQAENDAHLEDKANEYLILARLTAIDFNLSDRYAKTVDYFEQSLKAAKTSENTFEYAYYLQMHNQFKKAQPYYEEALSIYRTLADAKPEVYLPIVAWTLNNLANVRKTKKNQYAEAEGAYKEALTIFRTLAEANSDAYLPSVALTLNNLGGLRAENNQYAEAEQAYEEALSIYSTLPDNHEAYLPSVAMTMNNLANLQAAKNQYAEAERAYKETLTIYRALAEANPESYLPKVAKTLNMLANLRAKNQYAEAEHDYKEALAINRALAEANPDAYLPFVAMTLNDFGVLRADKNQNAEAEQAYEEALSIYSTLPVNPEAYLPRAMTLYNLANLQATKNQYAEAERAYKEALTIYRTLAEANPESYLATVAMTLNILANLRKKNQYAGAEHDYEEALAINRALAEANPEAHLPAVAMTAVNLSIFYFESVPNQEKSLMFAQETLLSCLPFMESLPVAQNYVKAALDVVNKWGLDEQVFLKDNNYKIGNKANK